MRFSLIVATLGRKLELIEMLTSIRKSLYDLDKVEVIIVDQNERGFISNDISDFIGLNIKYIHSEKKGLSYNRNIGLRAATGDILCFPDDDCKLYEDTLSSAEFFLANNRLDFCMGRIFCRKNNLNIIKKWPTKITKVNKFNSYFLNSSITLFVNKECLIEFDENLGVGANFGSCEDADYIYCLLDNSAQGMYSPDIELWHPTPDFQDIPLSKVENYAAGFRYYIRKNNDVIKNVLFYLLIIKKIYQLMFLRKKFKPGYFKAFFRGIMNSEEVK
ncbi:glycosyltransferase family 2 protein [Photobacterium sanguinicancri]|uniref:glycosyltransferase family 2 protein n=1 Tax=Photobacterium sanguinicancri TaxID=875932 RepID=UPI0026E184F9|nr:glycosyltransferase family 2 protein [Photobacterium sanguinicancri]MDO6499530.1 glycosyltransferase family 2 protein [Photobacterium sanguinicancri]